ncbi:MAG: MASE1 domain-containing protein [Panacagrimonas sp.]
MNRSHVSTPAAASRAGYKLRYGTLWRVLAVALVYAVSGKLSLLLAIPPGYATAVWPASGAALAACLLWGWRMWPGVLVGSFLVNVATSWDGSTLALAVRSTVLALSIGTGAALHAVVGAWLIRRSGGFANVFTPEAGVIRMLMLGGPASCVISASVGVGSLWTAGLIPTPNLIFNWWTWWVGDSIGVMIFTPLICAWSLPSSWRRQKIALSLPMGVLFAVVVSLFFYVSAGESKRLSAEFEARARLRRRIAKSGGLEPEHPVDIA